MPRRPRHLTFSPSPTPSSALAKPTSPTVPRTPLIPPLRLHQRTLIPSPPVSPQFLAMAPSNPHAWIWRCHVCMRTYRLGVTRRCLEDGHYFCSVPSPPVTPVGKKGKRHPPRGCRAEFDYTGWSNYNIWRREVKKIIAERNGLVGAISTTKGRWSDSDSDFDDLYLPLTPRWKERNCWIDCSFPSECHNYRARLLREKALLSTRWEEQRQREEVEVALFRDVYWREGSGVEEKGGEKGDGGEKADLSEEELKSLYLDMVVKGSDEPDVRIQDCDGLGEQGYRLEYTRSKRRKSIEALVLGDDGAVGAAEPNSPLKEEWGGEDGKVWEDVDLDEEDEDEENIGRGRSKERKPVNEDEQMREALLARSMFLRRFDWDDGGEKFGDEDESERI